jgi:hypothetical protein
LFFLTYGFANRVTRLRHNVPALCSPSVVLALGRGLLREKRERTIGDRSRGAVHLWKRFIAITAIQVATALAATIMEACAR